ncbi:MAG: rhodanese-like domain-containing protein [Balneolales bacterium]
MEVREIEVKELENKLAQNDKPYVLDVREPHEFEIANINGDLIPLAELEDRLGEVKAEKDDEIIVHCRSGKRSAEAVKILQKHGFTNAKNLKGGIHEWAKQIDPSLPIY